MYRPVLSWIVFVVIGGAMGYLRYGNYLPPDQMVLFAKYGPWIMIAIHAIVTLMAFSDTVFQGILCLLVPGYSYYYLFFVSDTFMIRAIVGGLLVGIAQDSMVVFQREANEIISKVNDWIAAGGERELPK